MSELKRSTVAALLRLSALEATDWGTALEQILRVDSETLGVDRVSYWSMRSEPRHFFCDLGYERRRDVLERGTVLEERFSPSYFQAIRDLQLIDVADARNDARTVDLRQYLEEREVGALLDVPIWLRGEPVGVLCHEHVGSPRQWTAADGEFVLAVAQVVVAALQSRERTKAELSEQRSVFLHRTARVLSATLDTTETERLSVRGALPLLGDAAMLDILHDGELERAAVAHVDPRDESRLLEIWRRFPPKVDGPHLSARVIRLQSAILVPVVAYASQTGEIDDDFARCLLDLRIRSSMAVPMRVQQRPAGAMVFYTTRSTYGHEDLRLAEEYVELVSLALENAYLFERVQQAIHARDEFISLASHELRTPLTALRASAEALASGFVRPSEMASLTGTVVRQVDRLDRLAQRMIDTVEVRSGAFSIHRKRTDLAALVRSVADDFSSMLRQSGCQLKLRIDGPITGDWDAARLQTVVSNLLDNAIRFGKGDPIEMEVTSSDDAAVLSVRDHGGGLPPEIAEGVFEQYSRGSPSRAHGGLGLGLYVVRGIVHAHGGVVRAIGHGDAGTTIIVELPHHPSRAIVEARHGEDPRPHRG